MSLQRTEGLADRGVDRGRRSELRRTGLKAADALWTRLVRPLLFRASAQRTHEALPGLLAFADAGMALALTGLRRAALPPAPLEVGGVRLESPYMVAAGLVKGLGFATEEEALAAVAAGQNVIPGWRSVPALAGAVEFGSFTRHPRLGNPAPVAWRDEGSRSLQNRVGLRNPGARAAAAFLASRAQQLPAVYGINVATTPGLDDDAQLAREVAEAVAAFVDEGVRPGWFTLNLSCPNTEDDPAGTQSESRARAVCTAALEVLREADPERPLPLWVKVGPDLAADTYRRLAQVFAELGVRAVVATNTLARTAPDGTTAGVGGGELHGASLQAAAALMEAAEGRFDVIGCGGVLDGPSCDAYAAIGVRAFQCWSAFVFRGPLAPALIDNERTSPARRPMPEKPSTANGSAAQVRPTPIDPAAALLDAGVVVLTPEEPVTFKSGIRSPVYIDARRLPFNPAAWSAVLEAARSRLADEGVIIDAVAGIETAGIPHGAALAYALGVPFVFVRKQAKEHGLRRLVEGGDVSGQRVLLVEDLVTTGGSSLAGVAALREAGAEVTDVLAVIAYGLPEATDAFGAAGVRLHVLAPFESVLAEAFARGVVDRSGRDTVLAWRANPRGWEPA